MLCLMCDDTDRGNSKRQHTHANGKHFSLSINVKVNKNMEKNFGFVSFVLIERKPYA